MESEQITSMGALQEVQDTTRQRPRRARRKVMPAAMNKAWLVLMAALAMTVLEGAFRKWVPVFGGEMGKYLMYFSKDIIFAALLLFPKRSLPSPAMKILGNWLIPGCVLVLAGAVLSSAHGINPVGALLTSRAVIILPLLAWLAVPRLTGLKLGWVLWLLIAFTVLNSALGVEQNRLPPDHILNRYSDKEVDVVTVASGVRATGTFSYIAGMALISTVGIWAGLALMSLAKNQRQRIGAWIALAAGFGCGLAAVSRGPVVIGVVMVAGWMICSRAGVSALASGLVTAFFCVVVATGIGLTPVFSDLGEGFLQRATGGGDTFNGRAFGQFDETITAFQMAPLGTGFGFQQNGGIYAATGTTDLTAFESPLPRLVLETGILGLIGYLTVCAGALLALQCAKRETQSAGVRAMLLATQLLLLSAFYGSAIFNHTSSAFTWMIFAAVLAAAELKPEAGGQMPEGGKQKTESRNQRADRKGKARHSVRTENAR